MKIGIVGTGRMGRTLGVRWAQNGHEVLFGSRDPRKAEEAAKAAGKGAKAGDFDAAAAFGDVVLYTVRDVFPSSLLRNPRALDGKIVVDCNNSDMTADFEAPVPIPSLAERLAADVPEARVVKAFNTLPHVVLELDRDKLAPHRISVFLSSNDAAAKAVVKGLAEELGLVGVDSGELERARLSEMAADFLRFHIAGMGLGLFATLSIHVLPER